MTRLPLSARLPGWLGALLLWVPLLAVIAFSFNSAKYRWESFTLDWYRQLSMDDVVLEATRNTFIVAVLSTVAATLLGTTLALALERYPWPRWLQRGLEAVVDLPVVTPDIVMAAALVIAFWCFGLLAGKLQFGLATIVVAHITFEVSFVTLVVRGRLQVIGRSLAEAGQDLYATRSFYLWRVTLPLLFPGILAGAVLAFTLSVDDFVISFLTCGSTNTLPLYIFSATRTGLTPKIHALSTLVIAGGAILVVALMLSGSWVQKEEK